MRIKLKPVRQHFFVQWLHPRFYQAVADLECYSCENFWTRNDIQLAMDEEYSSGYVLTAATTPVGYVVFTTREGQGIILNLVVHPDHRQMGWGTLLLQRALDRLEEDRHLPVVADVRESNLGAQLFLKRNDFRAVGVQKDFFQDYYEHSVEKEDSFHFVRSVNAA